MGEWSNKIEILESGRCQWIRETDECQCWVGANRQRDRVLVIKLSPDVGKQL